MKNRYEKIIRLERIIVKNKKDIFKVIEIRVKLHNEISPRKNWYDLYSRDTNFIDKKVKEGFIITADYFKCMNTKYT